MGIDQTLFGTSTAHHRRDCDVEVTAVFLQVNPNFWYSRSYVCMCVLSDYNTP